MTIAVAYLASEGIVLGADSTSSVPCNVGLHYFDFNQKLFEIGEDSTVGILTWGLGGLEHISYRTLVAQLADELKAKPASSIQELTERWVDLFWNEYSNLAWVKRVLDLHAKAPFDPTNATPGARTEAEQEEYDNLRFSLVVGFCVAGYVLPSRIPQMAEVTFDPLNGKPKSAIQSQVGFRGWGVPNIISRLVNGADENLKQAILTSGKWNGTPGDLNAVIAQQMLAHATLPIRDAVDFVYSCIYSTIKAMKFSSMPQVCGGPIEVAVITTDRKFRWVRHKPWDAAITDGAM